MEPALIISLCRVLPRSLVKLNGRGECNIKLLIPYLAIVTVVSYLDQCDCTVKPSFFIPIIIIVLGTVVG